MSLKHTQFQDSPTMRSYTKIAQEKGWIQEEPLKKEASAPDYQPTANLMENVLKLCRGLRQTGFDKYAEELESKFVQFKQADCHYDVSGEKGEDLVDAAHPEGSHKLVDVEGDSVIETIVDQHMKILEKILKMPHGKLSTSAEIIDAVKVVLAQSYDDVKKKLDSAYNNAYNAYSAAQTAGKLSIPTLFWMKGQIMDLYELTSKPSQDPPERVSLDEISEAVEILHKVQNSVRPGLHMLKGITDPAILKTVNGYLAAALQDLAFAGDMIKRLVIAPSETKPAAAEQYTKIAPVEIQAFTNPILKNVEERAQNLMDNLDSYKLVGKISRNEGAMKYINDQRVELTSFLTRLYQIKPERQDAMAPNMQRELEGYEAYVDQFEKDWVKGGK